MISSLFAKVGVRPAWLLATCLLALGLLLPPGQAGAESGEPGNGNNGEGQQCPDCPVESPALPFSEQQIEDICDAAHEHLTGTETGDLPSSAGGAVICCDGLRVACVFTQNWPEWLIPEEGYESCRKDVRKCAWEHENSHILDPLGECRECDGGTGISRHDAKGESPSFEYACNLQATECIAYTIQKTCLQQIDVSTCDSSLSNWLGVVDLQINSTYSCSGEGDPQAPDPEMCCQQQDTCWEDIFETIHGDKKWPTA